MNQLSLNFGTLQRGYQRGEFSPTMLINEIYRRAKHSINDHVWTHRLPYDQVHEAALRLEALAASGAPLPLFGPPFSYIARRTAAVVERLQARS